MVIGVGTDIIEIQRIANAIERGNFLEKSFTVSEIEYFVKKGSQAETLAGMFAGKEGVAKAMGSGFRGFALRDIEITHGDLGEPMVVLSDKAMEVARVRGISSFKISISHNKTVAIAYVVAI